ncbi:hypothetical protein DM02DRAFT_727695 [Periconia macrospinosa]|uniref:F-box domain-containing protein n=1 Tax=Periconia macrospinosa TaxID=97972 RepID=A0A2V1DUY1_9PLEO|nr:hypothetical protein DM02DRAFT_727695 [Periconia macrospinosa]
MALDYLPLTNFPPELLIKIYQSLSSPLDALNLRSTCQFLHSIWKTHRSGIANELAIRTIECYPYARQLLADQRRNGPQPPLAQADLSDHDLFNLVRNSDRVEEFVSYIEHELIPELKVEDVPASKKSTIYEGRATHPSKLTHTERRRVIRACYQIWSLSCCFDEKITRIRAYHLRPRQLFYVAELVHVALRAKFPTDDVWDVLDVVQPTREAITRLYAVTYHRMAPRFRTASQRDVELFTIWDHCQDTLKNVICKPPIQNFRWEPQAVPQEHLWDYEDGDELFIAGG